VTEKTPQDVVAHHLAALEQGNLANLMADYAEHAVMMFPDRSLRGHDSIKDFFAEALDQYGRQALAGVEVLRQDSEGDIVYVVWVQHPDTPQTMRGCDTYQVKDDRIVLQAVFDA